MPRLRRLGLRFHCRFERDQNVCPTDVVSIDESRVVMTKAVNL